MMLAAIMTDRRTDLVQVIVTLTGQRYIDEILTPHVMPQSRNVGANFIFQQDNARPHTTRVSPNCLLEATLRNWHTGLAITFPRSVSY